MIWASRWSVALRTFYRQILSVLYSSFPFGNFRPRLVRVLLVNYKPSIWGYPPIFGNIHMAIYYGYDGDLIPSFNSWFTRHFRRYRILAQNLSHARPLEDSKFPFFSNKTKRTKDSKKNPSTRRNPRRPPYLQPSQGETC